MTQSASAFASRRRGAKSYIYQFRMGGRGAPVRREVIGRVEKMSPEQARNRAHELAYMVRTGTDHIERKHADRKAKEEAKLTAEQLAFDAYCQRYIDQRVRPERLASLGNIEMVLPLHAIPHLKSKPLPDITKRDMVAVLDGIPPTSLGLRRSAFAILNPFTAREIQRKGRSGLADKSRVASGLSALVDADWIAAGEVETGGRPMTVYSVNPKALKS